MEDHQDYRKKTLPFYQRMTTGTYDNINLQLPSNEDLRDSGIHNISAFQNDISITEKGHRISLIRPNVDNSHIEGDELQISATKDHIQSILTPTAIICVPIALLTAALLALVLIFRVDPQPNLFTSSPSDSRGRGYILVNFSASKSTTSH
jgi:hypothetical protein